MGFFWLFFMATVLGSDFTLGSSIVTVSASAMTTITLTLLADNVALEDRVENVTLTIVPMSSDDVANNAIFRNQLEVSITDTDGMQQYLLGHDCMKAYII